VTAALIRPGLDLVPFADDPLRPEPELPDARQGDAVLILNYFGLRAPVEVAPRDGIEVIEDHSHDPASPWAMVSTADFCVASLRKTLPLPEGGVLWSPRQHPLPADPEVTDQRRLALASKLQAMILKAMYLEGEPVEKSVFRMLSLKGEHELDVPSIAGMSELTRTVLRAFPSASWRQARAANHAVLADRLAPLGWARLLHPVTGAGVPLSAVVMMDTAQRREAVRSRLIEERVYPSVLWSLEDPVLRVGHRALELSRRVLSIHCDGRYTTRDMERIAELVVKAGGPA